VSARRRRSRSREHELKDKVLHARIPDELDRELRDRAGRLGLSVSTVVRNVLLHTFDLVEGIVTDGAEVARAVRGEPARGAGTDEPKSESEAATTVVGWQEVLLNLNAICVECNQILPRGERAGVGVPIGTRPSFLCPSCLEVLCAAATTASSSGSTSVSDPPPARPRRRGSGF